MRVPGSPFVMAALAVFSLGTVVPTEAGEAPRAAQQAAAPGSRVRVTAPSVVDRRVVGTLLAIDREVITVRWDTTGTVAGLPLDRVEKLEVSGGMQSHVAAGTLLGALVGGVGLGLVLSNPPSSATEFQVNGLAVALGVSLGAMSGALAGATARTERWTTVGHDHVALALQPGPGRGAAVALRLTF